MSSERENDVSRMVQMMCSSSPSLCWVATMVTHARCDEEGNIMIDHFTPTIINGKRDDLGDRDGDNYDTMMMIRMMLMTARMVTMMIRVDNLASVRNSSSMESRRPRA